MDKIILNRIELRPIIGTLPHERLHRQRIWADLALELDLQKAAQSDDLNDTIDYSAIEAEMVQVADNSQFKLLEALSGALLDAVWRLAPALHSSRIRLEKPAGSQFGRSVVVELERSRS